jgi:membrane-bound metal-dependent hydrolase YbcI (DUF457 family)
MDNLTHTLFGATLARTPLNRAGRGTTAALLLASNAPDIDIVTTVNGALSYLHWHRGPTHGPLGVVALGTIVAGLVWSGSRLLDRDSTETHATFRSLSLVSIVGVLFHVLMDLPTSYGTRLLSPFDWHWYAADLMPIVDIYLLAALAACFWFGSRMEWRRRNVVIALSLMALNYGVRIVAHRQALEGQHCLNAAPRLVNKARSSIAGRSTSRWPAATPNGAVCSKSRRCPRSFHHSNGVSSPSCRMLTKRGMWTCWNWRAAPPRRRPKRRGDSCSASRTIGRRRPLTPPAAQGPYRPFSASHASRPRSHLFSSTAA